MHVPDALCCRHSAARGYRLASHQVPVKKRPRDRCSTHRMFDTPWKCAVFSLKIYTMVSMAVLFIVFGIGTAVSICTRYEALAYAQKYRCVDICGLCKSGGRNIYILCEGLYALPTVFHCTY